MGLMRVPSSRAGSSASVRSASTSTKPLSSPAVYETEVRVLFELADLGMTYVEDKQAKRYFIDSESDLAFKAVKGQVLKAKVNRDGYVLAASLSSR